MLTRDNTGLVVVDVQGKLATMVDDSEAVIARMATLIKGATLLQLPLLWLEQNPAKLGATVAPLSDVLAPSQPITKYTFDACGADEFVAAARAAKVANWLVCGIEAHICVYQTCLGLVQFGFGVEVVSDCVASRAPANKQLAIQKLLSQGVGVTSLEMCLYELVGDCRAAEFRQMLQLVK